MREHKYRAKRLDDGEWVNGSLITKYDADACCVSSCYILEKFDFTISVDWNTCIQDCELIEVDPNTVCEFTGLKDKNGKKIFEGDIVAPKYITPVGELTEDLDYDRKGVIELVAGSYVIKRPNHNQTALYSLVELEDMGYVSNVGNVYRPKNNICFVEVIGNIFDNPEILGGEKR